MWILGLNALTTKSVVLSTGFIQWIALSTLRTTGARGPIFSSTSSDVLLVQIK